VRAAQALHVTLPVRWQLEPEARATFAIDGGSSPMFARERGGWHPACSAHLNAEAR